MEILFYEIRFGGRKDLVEEVGVGGWFVFGVGGIEGVEVLHKVGFELHRWCFCWKYDGM